MEKEGVPIGKPSRFKFNPKSKILSDLIFFFEDLTFRSVRSAHSAIGSARFQNDERALPKRERK